MPTDHERSNNWIVAFMIAISGYAIILVESVVIQLSLAFGILTITGIGKSALNGLRTYSKNAQLVACDLLVLVFLTGSLTLRAYEPELFAYVKWAAALLTGIGFAVYHISIGALRWYGPDLVNKRSWRWLPAWRRNPYIGATMCKRLGFLLFAVYYFGDPIIFAATGLSFLVSFERILDLLHDDEKKAIQSYLREMPNLVQIWAVLLFPALFLSSDIWNTIGAYASALIPVYFLILKLRVAEIYDFRYWFPFLVSGAGLIAFALAMGTYPIAAYELAAAVFFVPAAVFALFGDRSWEKRRERDRKRREEEEKRMERRRVLDKRREFLLKLRIAEMRAKRNRPMKQTKVRSIKGRIVPRRIKKAKQGRRKRKRRPSSPQRLTRGFLPPPPSRSALRRASPPRSQNEDLFYKTPHSLQTNIILRQKVCGTECFALINHSLIFDTCYHYDLKVRLCL